MMFNWQLSYQEIRWPVSRDHTTSSGLELIKVVCFDCSVKLTLTICLFSIGSRAYVSLACLKKFRIVRKPVDANPGLKVNQITTFSPIQISFAPLFAYMVFIKKSKQEAKQNIENLTAKLQNSD